MINQVIKLYKQFQLDSILTNYLIFDKGINKCMIIKNLGQVVLFKLRIFKIASKLSPLIVLAAFALFYLIIDMREDLDFQQPILSTKVQDLNKRGKKQQQVIVFDKLSDSIEQYLIQGIMQHQTILITLSANTSVSFCSKIIKQLEQDNYLSKNVVFVRYQAIEHLESILKDPPFYWGVIRAGLNLDLVQNGQKLFYKIHGKNGDQPDMDYYNAIRDLIHKVGLTWTPCQSILKFKPFKLIRQFIKQMFVDQTMCQLYQNFSTKKTAHSVLQGLGIQAATLKTVELKANKKNAEDLQETKLQKIVLSFIKQFSLMEDHLHSAQTLYIPADNYKYVGVVKYMLPSLVLIFGVLAFEIKQYWFEEKQKTFELSYLDALLFLVFTWQWYFINSVHFAWMLVPLRLRFGSRNAVTQRLVLLILQVIISFYLSIFNFSLGFLAMICSALLYFAQRMAILYVPFIIVGIILMGVQEFSIEGQVSLLFLPSWLFLFSRLFP